MVRSLDTSRGNRLFYSPKRPDGLCGPPSLLLDEKEWKGCEAHHSSPSSAEVRYECSYIDTHGVIGKMLLLQNIFALRC
jgi:hypothetical protein